MQIWYLIWYPDLRCFLSLGHQNCWLLRFTMNFIIEKLKNNVNRNTRTTTTGTKSIRAVLRITKGNPIVEEVVIGHLGQIWELKTYFRFVLPMIWAIFNDIYYPRTSRDDRSNQYLKFEIFDFLTRHKGKPNGRGDGYRSSITVSSRFDHTSDKMDPK